MTTFAGRYGPDNYVDTDGVPQPGLSVTVRLPGTTTAATLYTDRTKSTGASNPVIADALGNVSYWADPGLYDHYANGATIEDVRVPEDSADLSSLPILNVQNHPYLAVGDGTTDDTDAIQAALDDARTAGGGIVLLPTADYLVSQQVHPINGAYHGDLVIGSDTTLFCMPGAHIIQDDNQAEGTQASAIVINYNVSAGDTGIKFFGGIYDGNGSNQTETQSGILLVKTSGTYLQNVEVRDCYGTASSGVNETFHFETQSGSSTTYVDCIANGTTSGDTASGFSANAHAHVHYIGCVAHGMTVANGFTHNASKDITHTDCHSYANQGVGFNSEISENVTYTACTAGGEALGTANYPFTSLQDLGNNAAGFVINGTTNGQLIGCTSEKNSAGAIFQDAGADLASGRVVGGSYSNNGYGIIWQGTSATRVEVIGNPIATGNATAQYQIPASNISAPGNPGYQPAVAATTVAVANPFPWDASVYIDGGTLTGGGVAVDGANLGNRSTVRVPHGKSVSISYSSAPTWVWILD